MSQKQITLFSLLAVVACAVALNELIASQSQEDQDRRVASFGERFEPKQIKWEQELAKTVSANPNSKTLLAKKPSLQDRLMFEVFEGQYEANIRDGRINKIVLTKDKNPVALDTKQIIEVYGSLFKDFAAFTVKNNGSSDVVNLTNKTNGSAGTIQVQRNNKGRVLQIEAF